MWRDPTKAEVACEALKITANDLLGMKIVDAIVPEPDGGAHNDHEESARLLRPVLEQALKELTVLTPAQLVDQRYEKYRHMAQFYGTAPIP